MTTTSIDLFNATPLQRRMMHSLYDGSDWHTLATVAPVGQGKTLGMALSLVDIALRHKALGLGNRQHLALGFSVGAIRRNMESYVLDCAEELGSSAKYVGGDRPHWLIDGDIRCWIYGGGNQASHRLIRGASVDSAVVDEVTLVDQVAYDTAQNRLRYDCSRTISTCNADSPDHWFRADVMEREGIRLLEADFYDNQHFPDARRKVLEQADPNSYLYRRNILNEWCPAEGLVFPLAPWMIVDEDPQPEMAKPMGWVSVDAGPGGTTAALLIVPTDYGGLIADEYYWQTQQEGGFRETKVPVDDATHFKNITDKWTAATMIPDPSAVNIRILAQQHGILTKTPDNDVDKGIRHTNHLLQRGILKVHQRCRVLRMACASYQYNPVTGNPVKRFDHAPDAMRYAAMGIWPPIGGYGFG